MKEVMESSINHKLAEILDKARYNWKVKGESPNTLDHGTVDLVVEEHGWPPVLIEAKIGMQDEDVDKRFKTKFKNSDRYPRIVFEIKYDKSVEEDISKLATTLIHYCIHFNAYEKPKTDLKSDLPIIERFPKDGFLSGGILDLATAIQYARIGAGGYQDTTEILLNAINDSAKIISEAEENTRQKISALLLQKESAQTWKMAALIISDAFMFHDHVAEHQNLPTLQRLGVNGGIHLSNLIDTWKKILEINYVPIFASAKTILEYLHSRDGATILRLFNNVRNNIFAKGLANSPYMHGEIFQRLIVKRKELAAFYTNPSSAALLASLTLPPANDAIYLDENIKKLRIADFACGTGSLLLASYLLVSVKYEMVNEGRTIRDLHDVMLGKCIIGADVLPTATHLALTRLASMHPKKAFKSTRIYQPEQGGKNDKIGSLEWILPGKRLTESETILTGAGTTGESEIPESETINIVVMNPPFTRSEGTGGGGGFLKKFFGILGEAKKKEI